MFSPTPTGPETPPRVILSCRPSQLARFFPLLQQGFEVQVTINQTVREVLCQDLALDPAYVESRIQTIFLDGKPVDDLDRSRVPPGATLALSAAMPGLVGAILRRGSYYAAMRQEITHREAAPLSPGGHGLIKLKLFNLLAAELGPALLARGLWLSWDQWWQFLQSCPEGFWSEVGELHWEDTPVSPGELLELSQTLPITRICLVVHLSEP